MARVNGKFMTRLRTRLCGQGGWVAPGTIFYAGITHRPFFIGEIIAGTCPCILSSRFRSHCTWIFPRRDGFTGTDFCADFAVLAKALQSEIDGLVRHQGHVCEHDSRLVSQSKEWIQDNPGPADLSYASRKQERRKQNRISIHKRWPILSRSIPSQAPDVIGDRFSYHPEVLVGLETDRIPHPIMPVGRPHCLKSLRITITMAFS